MARLQAGVLSRQQLLQLGYTDRSLDRASRDWTRLARGVYLLTNLSRNAPWESLVWAGVLLGGDGASAAGPTAAVLHGLLSLDETCRSYVPQVALRADAEVHVLTPGRRVSSRPGFVFIADPRGSLPSRGQDPPRTRIEDTVLDLCAAGPAPDAVTWLSRACQRRLTSEKRLLTRMQERPTVRHAALLRSVLGDIGAGATTELERRVMHDVFRAHGLPEGRPQVRVGSRGRIVDILLEEYALVIELDGKIGHVEEGAFRDRRRDNANTMSRAWSLRYGWQEACGWPCGCAAEIAQALWDRGWRGEFHTCPACAC